VPFDTVIGIIAGGDAAIRKAQEFAEDNTEQAIKDLEAWQVNPKDMVVGISASGKTPYVLGGLEACNALGIPTGCIVCNKHSAIAAAAQYPVEVVVGPEFVTGSTRMKAGTAQKLVLNMLSTSAMIRLGFVKGNKMVNMQLTNNKLIDRGMRMLVEETGLSSEEALALLKQHGNVKKVLLALGK
jgi:N-acetylmuramic acid 6-phosphate etherase